MQIDHYELQVCLDERAHEPGDEEMLPLIGPDSQTGNRSLNGFPPDVFLSFIVHFADLHICLLIIVPVPCERDAVCSVSSRLLSPDFPVRRFDESATLPEFPPFSVPASVR